MFSIWVYRSGWTPNGPPEDWNEDVIGPVATGICYGKCSCSLTLARLLDLSLLVLNINIFFYTFLLLQVSAMMTLQAATAMAHMGGLLHMWAMGHTGTHLWGHCQQSLL